MSNPAYKMIGTPEDKLLEELGELIQAICKAKRFGLFSDYKGNTNLELIKAEMGMLSKGWMNTTRN